MVSTKDSIYPSDKSLYKYFSLYQSGYFSGVSDPANLLACYFAYFCTTKENILELGIGNGAFLYCLANGTNAPQTFGVDNFDAPFGFPAEKFITQTYSLLNNLLNQNKQITLINSDTKKLPSIGALPAKHFSLIHIDADHSTESVFSDAQNASSLLSEDGLLVFDDIHLETVEAGVNTWLKHAQKFKKIFRFNNKIYVAQAYQQEKWNSAFAQFIETLSLEMITENDYSTCYFDLKKIYLGVNKEDLFGPMYNKWLEVFDSLNRTMVFNKADTVQPQF
jgi:predicted O-methyltransferase YrrM